MGHAKSKKASAAPGSMQAHGASKKSCEQRQQGCPAKHPPELTVKPPHASCRRSAFRRLARLQGHGGDSLCRLHGSRASQPTQTVNRQHCKLLLSQQAN